jgi:hypothetical protein
MEELNDAIARVSKYGATLANGAPHQRQLGQDILLVVGALAAAQLDPETGLLKGPRPMASLAASHTPVMDTLAPTFRRAQTDAVLNTAGGPVWISSVEGPMRDGVALTSASHEQFGTSIEEVVGKMRAGGVLGSDTGSGDMDVAVVRNIARGADGVDRIVVDDMVVTEPGPDQRQAKKTRKKG